MAAPYLVANDIQKRGTLYILQQIVCSVYFIMNYSPLTHWCLQVKSNQFTLFPYSFIIIDSLRVFLIACCWGIFLGEPIIGHMLSIHSNNFNILSFSLNSQIYMCSVSKFLLLLVIIYGAWILRNGQGIVSNPIWYFTFYV